MAERMFGLKLVYFTLTPQPRCADIYYVYPLCPTFTAANQRQALRKTKRSSTVAAIMIGQITHL